MRENLKWACIQPLTGGMYIGAEQAIGHKAEFILSYKGLDRLKYDKEGKLVSAGNEYNLKEYLKKHNDMPPYYLFDDKAMFDSNVSDVDIKIVDEDENQVFPDYSNLDLVIAVPVCSGLSMANTTSNMEVKEARNCNMIFIAKYALEVMKPKMYIFENAPTLLGKRGDGLRKTFEQYGEIYGYDVLYYKTDTLLHHNCQKRIRTFVVFIKKDAEHPGVPVFGFENATMSIKEFFDAIPEGLTQQTPVPLFSVNKVALAYAVHLFGEDWPDKIDNKCFMTYIIKNKMLDDFLEFFKDIDKYDDSLSERDKLTVVKYINHIKDKTSKGLGYYAMDIISFKDFMPAIMFKTMRTTLHPSNKRMCTVREYLELMGMPHDFYMYGDVCEKCGDLDKIGQNVPVKTAKFIIEEAVKVLENWDTVERKECNVLFVNNIKQDVKLLK